MFAVILRSQGLAMAVGLGAVASVWAAEPGSVRDTTAGFFRFPTTDGKSIVFTAEGDLWKVPLEGGLAVRLTSHEGEERFAHFSPDGRFIAFSGQDDGQDDVYLIPASGGEPRRLTYHPDPDQVMGWDYEGNILFRSRMEVPYRGVRMYRLRPEGGWPQALPMDKAALVSFEPGGERVAFTRYPLEFRTWKRYQGGWAQDIWVGNLKTMEFVNVTDRTPLDDWQGAYTFPMWHTDGRIYFLSDRGDQAGKGGRANLFSMLPEGSDLRRHTDHRDYDVRWPSMGGGVIVYQVGMDVWAYDLATGRSRLVPVHLPSDRVQARVKFVDPKEYVSWYELSPNGRRLLLCSRGEIFTAPVGGKGLIRQLTYSSGSAEKYPAWSPDGSKVAYWTDATGEEILRLQSAEGGAPRELGTDGRGWHYRPKWSPDGARIAFSNQELELVVMDAKSGATRVVDQANWEIRDYAWSPDGRFLAWSRAETNYNYSIRVWDSRTGVSFAVTDDFYHNFSPAFDPEGKYLFFLSNRFANPHLDGQEMTYILDKRTRVLAVGLKAGTPLPLAPTAEPPVENEEEKGGERPSDGKSSKSKPDKAGKGADTVVVTIDTAGLAGRVTALNLPADNYFNLRAVKGRLFVLSSENDGMLDDELFDDEPRRGFALHRYDFVKDKFKTLVEGVRGYDLSGDGKKLLIYKDKEFTVIGVDEDYQPEERVSKRSEERGGEERPRKVDLSDWDLRVDVRAEWRQMFREAWRLQRDFFWEPGMHGVDWAAVYEQYSRLAPRISTRDELNDLIGEMLGELNCSHTYVWGGDKRTAPRRSTGLLGVDVTRDSATGFWRIERVIAGRPWEADASSPLAAPGIDARAGEYIVAINGRSTASVPNYLELLVEKAGEITAVTLNDRPALEGGREVIVKPLASEVKLRYLDWVDGRKAYVDRRSGGKIGYIHLTDMGGEGLSEFTAGYQPQHNKPALIMDVRYNGGGFVAEMILSHLGRKVFAFGRPRHGSMYRSPQTAFYGHLAAVCNAETGSDGETFTEGFKALGLGPVIGMRTWGGWVGIRGDKPFVDFGMVTEPEFTGWGLDGKWLIEGHGTDPDIVVKEEPAAYLEGRDPLLDAAVDYLLAQLRDNPKEIPPPPPYPDRSLK